MSFYSLIIRSIAYYRKQHMGVFTAVILATAVLTGALIVGDSVVKSLQQLVETRLGKANYVLYTGDRYLTVDLGKKLNSELNEEVSSVLLLQTIAINTDKNLRKNNVSVIGIDENFRNLGSTSLPEISINEVIISENLAGALSVNIGDNILLRINNTGLIPVNAPFADNSNPYITQRVIIKDIANDDMLGRFSLRNDQKPPYNIFINWSTLSSKTELSGKISCILVKDVETDPEIILNKVFSIEDAGLIRKINDIEGYVDLTSDQIFINDNIAGKVPHSNGSKQILTYFTNQIIKKDRSTPYSFVSAVSDNFFTTLIENNHIVINRWLANDLDAKIGDTLSLKYYQINRLHNIIEKEASFIVFDIITTENNEYYRSLMPNFPGLSNAESCGDWESEIPIDLTLIRDKDEQYWDDFKGIPKAFISLEAGQELWKNSYGGLTLLRYGIDDTAFVNNIKILPKDLGYSFINMKKNGIEAASNGVDFGQLFLSLSFFIIFSSVLLIILILNLNLQNRKFEIGILMSLGLSNNSIFKFRLIETMVIIIPGAIIGGLLGIYYNDLVIYALNSVWNDALHADMINVYVKPATVITGIISGMIISVISVFFSISRSVRTHSVISLTATGGIKSGNAKISKVVFILSLLISLYLILFEIVISNSVNPAYTLATAFILIIALVAAFALFIGYYGNRNSNSITINSLAIKNLSRNKKRSIASVTMLAIGVFTIFVTSANRLTFNNSESNSKSGTGGMNYWIESTIPLSHDLNTQEGKQEFGLDSELLSRVDFIQLPRYEGDDASCLNLNQIQQPSIIGINPNLFDSLQLFDFSNSIVGFDNPWLSLKEAKSDSIIPAIADQTVIQWGLIKTLGDTINVVNEKGKVLRLILVAGLKPSVFQGNLLIDDSTFRYNFPSSDGTRIVLTKVTGNNGLEISSNLQKRLTDYGIEIGSTTQRLLNFYSVTNTYLTIFLFLGGLGILIGTIGFGLVMIRNIIERKDELSTYNAIGFQRHTIFKIIVVENMIITITGLIIGLVSSIIGILPSLLTQSYTLPGNTIFIILSAIIINIILWIVIPARFFTKRFTSKNYDKKLQQNTLS